MGLLQEKMPLFTVPSLKEICSLAVIKTGTVRINLPSTLADEVEELEGRIKSIFTGTFQRPTDIYTVVTLTIAWTQGQWELTLNNHETLVVKSGVENTLGKIGGQLFLLPGRSVTIFDYKLDLERKKLSFVGKCSSSTKRMSGRSVEIVLNFEDYPEMIVETYRECKDKCLLCSEYKLNFFNMKIFLKDSHYDPHFFNYFENGDTDSSDD